jgi:hypothetical protein
VAVRNPDPVQGNQRHLTTVPRPAG